MNTFHRRLFFCAFFAVMPLFFIRAAVPQDKPLRIVTSFYPVYIAALNIVKNVPGIKLVNLTPPLAGCLHDYQLTPDDMKTLAQADLLIVNGAGMESFIEKALREIKPLKIIDASRGIELIQDKNGVNPHVWLSVTLAIKQAQNITASLGKLDPAHSELYQANCAGYVKKLEDLRMRMKSEISRLKCREIITFHEAFPYFAREFKLNIIGVIERDPGSEPSARELVETIQLIKKHKARVICIEPQYPDKSARLIAAETGARICTLDPIVTGPMNKDAYIRIMEANLDSLLKALKD